MRQLQSKRYSDILGVIENEIQDIVLDQRRVIDTMKIHLKDIHNQMEKSHQSEDYDNQIIRSYLDMHRPSIGGLVLRASGFVKSRATEKELIKKFELLADLQRFMRPNSVIEREPQSPTKRIKAEGAANLVSESRRKFLAALQCAKTKPASQNLTDSDEDLDDVEFLSEEPLYPPSQVAEFLQQQQREGDMVAPRKRGRGRPRKSRLGLLNCNDNSAPSTRASSPVTMPYVDLPEEVEETNDYDQPGFLLKFGLYTLEMSEKLKTRRPERRRRNVQSTEKTDFHYGQIEVVMVSRRMRMTRRILIGV